jgi:hypothetical protein
MTERGSISRRGAEFVGGERGAFKLRTIPWTKIHESVNYFILFYFSV